MLTTYFFPFWFPFPLKTVTDLGEVLLSPSSFKGFHILLSMLVGSCQSYMMCGIPISSRCSSPQL